MAEDILKSLEDELKCSICIDTYTDPKLLQCHHFYCLQCLNGLVEKDQQGHHVLTCPNCRQVTLVPVGGIESLPTAFHINSLLEILRRSATISYCFVHDDQKSEFYCVSCQEFICGKCTRKSSKHLKHNHFKLDSTSCEKYRNDAKASLNERLEHEVAVFKNSQVTLNQLVVKTPKLKELEAKRRKFKKRKNADVIPDLQVITQQKKEARYLKSLEDHSEIVSDQITLCHRLIQKFDETSSLRKKLITLEQAKKTVNGLQSTTMELHQEIEKLLQDKADSSKCYATGNGRHFAVVNEKSTVLVEVLNSSNQPGSMFTLKCELVSCRTNVTLQGSIKNVGQSQHEITYQPIVSGMHRLHITVDGQDICESPFDVIVMNMQSEIPSHFAEEESVLAELKNYISTGYNSFMEELRMTNIVQFSLHMLFMLFFIYISYAPFWIRLPVVILCCVLYDHYSNND